MMQNRFTDMQHIIDIKLYQFRQNTAKRPKERI